MFIHDTLKIKYVREGFLPDYPYHLISDEEMFQGFLNISKLTKPNGRSILQLDYQEYIEYKDDYMNSCYFIDNYPCIDRTFWNRYKVLMNEMQYHINRCIDSSNHIHVVPDWVYSYMIGSTIGPNSNTYDIHDVLVMINMDNLEDEITIPIYEELYKVSVQAVNKLSEQEKLHRPPTIFGEPHVVKLLRLEQAGI